MIYDNFMCCYIKFISAVLSIFPRAFVGNSSKKMIFLGTLKSARCCLQNSISVFESVTLFLCGLTNAHTTLLLYSCFPTTTATLTALCLHNTFSTSLGATLSPSTMMIFLRRSINQK